MCVRPRPVRIARPLAVSTEISFTAPQLRRVHEQTPRCHDGNRYRKSSRVYREETIHYILGKKSSKPTCRNARAVVSFGTLVIIGEKRKGAYKTH
jgi:hypothetical protein